MRPQLLLHPASQQLLPPLFIVGALAPVGCQGALHILYLTGPLPETPEGDTVKMFYVGE